MSCVSWRDDLGDGRSFGAKSDAVPKKNNEQFHGQAWRPAKDEVDNWRTSDWKPASSWESSWSDWRGGEDWSYGKDQSSRSIPTQASGNVCKRRAVECAYLVPGMRIKHSKGMRAGEVLAVHGGDGCWGWFHIRFDDGAEDIRHMDKFETERGLRLKSNIVGPKYVEVGLRVRNWKSGKFGTICNTTDCERDSVDVRFDDGSERRKPISNLESLEGHSLVLYHDDTGPPLKIGCRVRQANGERGTVVCLESVRVLYDNGDEIVEQASKFSLEWD